METITGVSREAPRITRIYRRNAYLENEKLVSLSRKIELMERALAVLEILLCLRFVFLMFALSYSNPFAAIDYVITFPFVLPFYGLLGFKLQSGLLMPMLETLVAMIAWAVIAWVAIGFARMNARKMNLT